MSHIDSIFNPDHHILTRYLTMYVTYWLFNTEHHILTLYSTLNVTLTQYVMLNVTYWFYIQHWMSHIQCSSENLQLTMPRDRPISYVCGQNVWTKVCSLLQRRSQGYRWRRFRSRSQRATEITSTWLKHEKADCDYVVTLKCSLSIQFNEKLGGMCNCNHAFVVGSKKLLASSYKDHAAADKQCFFRRSRAPVMSLNTHW